MENEENLSKKQKKKLRKSTKNTLVACMAVLAVILLVGGYCASQALPVLHMAKTLKRDVKEMAAAAMKLDMESVRDSMERMDEEITFLREKMDSPLFRMAGGMSIVNTEYETANALLEVAEKASNDLLKPGLELMDECPPETWEGTGREKSEMLVKYMRFAEASLPETIEIMSQVQNLELGRLDKDGKIADAVDKAAVLLKFADHAADGLLGPAIAQLDSRPIEGVRQGEGGLNALLFRDYLDFAEPLLPRIEALLEEVKGGALDAAVPMEKLSKYIDKADSLFEMYHENEDLLPFVREFLGSGENKLYLFTALNSTELRALGGFPGSVGTIEIRDGGLYIGEFTSCYNVFPTMVPLSAGITGAENMLFKCTATDMNVTWDGSLCPDFERVSEIWSIAYESRNGKKVDGIIAMSPIMIQKLLAAAGEITLEDGTVLNGDNATRVLQRDMYYKYFTKTCNQSKSNAIVDKLFAETAKKTMQMVTGGLNPSVLRGCVSAAREGLADRIIMVWMADPEAQEIVREMGWNGGLTGKPGSQILGVYFSCIAPGKMGWYVDIDTEIGEPTENADGSRTYPVAVTFTDTITPEEIEVAGWYIVGSYLGSIPCEIHIFAPEGGNISAFQCRKPQTTMISEYHGLRLGLAEYCLLRPNEPVTFTCMVTTAPGSDAPLELRQTPTLTQYR